MRLSSLADQIIQTIEKNSSDFGTISLDVKQQLKGLIDSQIEQLGLVTREEFETLRLSLNRSNERITKLEKILEDNEAPDI